MNDDKIAMEKLLKERKTDFSDLNIFDISHYGWMSPDGTFYHTKCMEHLSFAEKLATFLYGNDNVNERKEECLYAHGWLAIHPYGICEDYLFTWRGHLTEDQKRVIKPFAEKWGDNIANLTKRDLYEELELDMNEDNK